MPRPEILIQEPTDPKKLRDTIRRYERAFKAPHYDDRPWQKIPIRSTHLTHVRRTRGIKIL
jgi:hypothetical protein